MRSSWKHKPVSRKILVAVLKKQMTVSDYINVYSNLRYYPFMSKFQLKLYSGKRFRKINNDLLLTYYKPVTVKIRFKVKARYKRKAKRKIK